MTQLKFALFILFGLFVFNGSLLAQSEKVVIYNDYNFQGANTALDGSWSGGGAYDKNIRSIQVPKGYRVTLYTEKNYKGTETRLTENWNPGTGAWWTTRIRSIRIDRAQIQPPVEPSKPKGFPTIYAQPNLQARRKPSKTVTPDAAIGKARRTAFARFEFLKAGIWFFTQSEISKANLII